MILIRVFHRFRIYLAQQSFFELDNFWYVVFLGLSEQGLIHINPISPNKEKINIHYKNASDSRHINYDGDRT